MSTEQSRFEQLLTACGQLGTYDSLLNYAINALNGKTACSHTEVATYLIERRVELATEQNFKIFKSNGTN